MVLLSWLTSAVGGAQKNNRCSAKTWLTGKGDLSIQGMKLARHWQARGTYSTGHKQEEGDSQGSEVVWYLPDKSWKNTGLKVWQAKILAQVETPFIHFSS